MKILVLLVSLVLCGASWAACPSGWTDEGGGECSVVPVKVQMTEAEAVQMEQLRKYHNWQYRCSGVGTICSGDDQFKVAEWFTSLLTGIKATQQSDNGSAVYLGWCDKLWRSYKKQLPKAHPEWLVSPGADKDVNAENANIPSPPSP